MADFVFVIFFLALVGILIFFLFKLSEKIGQQSQINLDQAKAIQEIKEKLLLGAQLQDHLKNGMEKTRDLIEELRKNEGERREREREFLERIKRVDEIVAGTSAKGISGEEILRETFKKLPSEMIERNFSVGGKVVEFALILPNEKRLPIDSKWPAGNLVLELEKEKEPKKRREIIDEIEKETIKRIKEVRQYIDPALTWSQAIAAVPDSVYNVCREAHLQATKENVILLPYSMVLPLILYMYRLHLQYSISIDLENLQNHLISISKNLDQMEEILENKIARGSTMVQNAYLDYKQMISRIRSSIQELQIKQPEQRKKLK
jgi:DNA recombination protein RmuC